MRTLDRGSIQSYFSYKDAILEGGGSGWRRAAAPRFIATLHQHQIPSISNFLYKSMIRNIPIQRNNLTQIPSGHLRQPKTQKDAHHGDIIASIAVVNSLPTNQFQLL